MKDCFNEIPRETLTYQIIRNDLKKDLARGAWGVLIFACFALAFLFLAFKVDYESEPIVYYYIWFITIVFNVCAIILLGIYIKSIVQFKHKTTIVTDWLVDISEIQPGRRSPYYQFTFAKYGEFRLYMNVYGNTNYTWSKMYAMSNQGIYNYSNVDDEFYLVITNDKKSKILQIYNQKLFELK